MAMTVWKFLVKASGASIKGVPLHIGLDPQTREPAIWCLCDPNDKDEQLRPMPYVVVMTGEPIPEEALHYVATVTGISGWAVAHFFLALPPDQKLKDAMSFFEETEAERADEQQR